MSVLKQFEFLVIRYVPRIDSDQYVNVGVVLLEGGAAGTGFADVKFIDDFAAVPMMDPETEVELLTELEVMIRERLWSQTEDCSKGGVAMSQRAWIVKTMQDSFSNRLQTSAGRSLLAEDPQKALDHLVRQFCEMRSSERASNVRMKKLTGRAYIRARIHDAFEISGLLGRLDRDFEVSDYVDVGGRMTFDYTYNFEVSPERGVDSNYPRVRKILHAVSLKRDVGKIRDLAFTWPKLREGIAQREESRAYLTAIVEDDVRHGDRKVDYAIRTMQDSGIAVTPLSLLPDVINQAKKDLEM